MFILIYRVTLLLLCQLELGTKSTPTWISLLILSSNFDFTFDIIVIQLWHHFWCMVIIISDNNFIIITLFTFIQALSSILFLVFEGQIRHVHVYHELWIRLPLLLSFLISYLKHWCPPPRFNMFLIFCLESIIIPIFISNLTFHYQVHHPSSQSSYYMLWLSLCHCE